MSCIGDDNDNKDDCLYLQSKGEGKGESILVKEEDKGRGDGSDGVEVDEVGLLFNV